MKNMTGMLFNKKKNTYKVRFTDGKMVEYTQETAPGWMPLLVTTCPGGDHDWGEVVEYRF